MPACDKSLTAAGGHKRSQVDLNTTEPALRAAWIADPNPKLDASLDRLADPAEPWISATGPSWEPGSR
jgi:hypothetical protein